MMGTAATPAPLCPSPSLTLPLLSLPVLGFEEVAACASDRKPECRCKPGMTCVYLDNECVHCEQPVVCQPGTEAEVTGQRSLKAASERRLGVKG